MSRNGTRGLRGATLATLILIPALLAGCASTPLYATLTPGHSVAPSAASTMQASSIPLALAVTLTPSVPATTPTPSVPATTSTPLVPTTPPSAIKGPASATLALTGTAGAASAPLIRCDQPDLDGAVITAFAGTKDPGVYALITISASTVSVRLNAGAGAQYTQRDFAGSGVSGFDPTVGAQVNATLTESTPATTKPGTLGAVTSIKGNVDCGDQTAGTSSVMITGSTAEGAVAGPFDSFRVECEHSAVYGDSVSVIAILTAATTPTWMLVNLTKTNSTLFSMIKAGDNHSYAHAVGAPGTLAISATGVQLEGDFTESVATGVTPHVLHFAGSLTCGSIVNS